MVYFQGRTVKLPGGVCPAISKGGVRSGGGSTVNETAKGTRRRSVALPRPLESMVTDNQKGSKRCQEMKEFLRNNIHVSSILV